MVGKESRHSGPKTRPASSRRWQLADSTAGLLKISRLSGRMPMPQQVRGVVVDPAAPGKLSIKPVELRDPDRDEVAVRVTAISLNRGETRRAVQQAEPGWRPGWDFAGVAGTWERECHRVRILRSLRTANIQRGHFGCARGKLMSRPGPRRWMVTFLHTGSRSPWQRADGRTPARRLPGRWTS